jgi:orotate phosphoribosyltransferase/AMMECR1 domain-containing protein
LTAASIGRRTDREELLALLLDRGILRRSEAQPVLSRDGTSARWMLDSLAVTLTPRGAELAGRMILERLQRFDGRQLATYGVTAVPILQSAVLQAVGRYHGLLVRNERKPYGSQKLIEGRIDLDEPVILIEDSIASGMSAREGVEKLEAAGLRVEGCIALVRFGWEGGCSDFAERGYHVEAVYDIFEDFMSRMEGEKGPDYNPTKCFPDFRWRAARAPDGLHPADLARLVMREYLASGELLAPPHSLDRDDYNSAGGAWVSIRSREDIHDRHARDGFWHFPDERPWGVAEDVIRAALKTAHELPKDAALRLLESSYVAVTFFSALERTTVGELDSNRYGIVVVSGERPEIMGGGLPRMPGIRDEWQQFHHARSNNAQLYEYEPYVLYRHEVSKYVESGAPWQPSGVPGSDESPDLGPLAIRARNIAMGSEPAEPLPPMNLPATAAQLFVTIYMDGEVCGCMGSEIGDLAEDLRTLTKAALADDRFEHPAPNPESVPDTSVAVSVSLLSEKLEMGDFTREEVRTKYRHGQQALMVEQGARAGLLLPFVASWLSLDAEGFVDEVLDKAGVTRPPYNWIRFDCDTWLADEDGVAKLEGGFKRLPLSSSVREIARQQVDYLLRNQREDGAFYFSYYPFDNTLYQGIDMTRLAHGAWTLARASKWDHAASALKHVLAHTEDDANELAREAFVLLAMSEPGVEAIADRATLAKKLAEAIDRHGRVTTWVPAPPTEDDDAEAEDEEANDRFVEDLQNYVPGQVLLALAAAARTRVAATDEPKIERAFRYYRHRFRYARDFGQVSWLALAAAAWWRLTQKRELADLLFEITDWILTFQQTHEAQSTRGGFLTDHQPGTPGFTTAVYLEAVAAALDVASAISDTARERRYDKAWQLGFEFLDRLIVQERDSSILPNAEYAIGGLREDLYSGHVRIDFVQHSLAAIMERHPDVFVNNQSD